MCGGLDLVVWWFSLLGGFGYMAPGFLVWICGGCLRKFSMCGGFGVPVLDVWWYCGCVVVCGFLSCSFFLLNKNGLYLEPGKWEFL